MRLAWLVAVALSLFATMRVWLDPVHELIGYPADPGQYVWFLAWWPHALLHGLNPLETHLANAPYGVNLMWNTSLFTGALLLSPITLTLGPVLAYNVLVLLCLSGNVVAAFMLLRRVLRSPRKALLMAVAFGASPLVAAHAVEHANLMFVGYPLIVLALGLDVICGRRSATRCGVLLGLLTACELLYGEEIVAITAVGLCLFGTWTVLRCREWVRSNIQNMLRCLGVALAVCLPLVAPFLAWQFLGPQQITPPLYPAASYSLDLTNLVLGTREQLLHSPLAYKVGVWSGGDVEATGLLLPLAVAVWFTRSGWRGKRIAEGCLTVAVISLVLAMGPYPHIAGHRLPVPLPGRLFEGIPVLRQIFATRLDLITWTAGLALLATALAGMEAQRAVSGRSQLHSPFGLATCARCLPLAVVVLLALPSWPLPGYLVEVPRSLFGSQPLVTSADVVEFAPSGGPGDSNPLLWQALTGFRWTMGSAYLVTPEEEDRVHGEHSSFPCLDAFVGLTSRESLALDALRVSCPGDLAVRLRAAGFTVLAVGPSPWQGQFLYKVARVLGPPEGIGDLKVWRLDAMSVR